MEELKQKVQKCVEQHYPKNIEQLDSVSDNAWKLYEELLNQYCRGDESTVGWYETIRFWMNFWNVPSEMAHIMASIRNKILE